MDERFGFGDVLVVKLPHMGEAQADFGWETMVAETNWQHVRYNGNLTAF